MKEHRVGKVVPKRLKSLAALQPWSKLTSSQRLNCNKRSRSLTIRRLIPGGIAAPAPDSGRRRSSGTPPLVRAREDLASGAHAVGGDRYRHGPHRYHHRQVSHVNAPPVPRGAARRCQLAPPHRNTPTDAPSHRSPLLQTSTRDPEPAFDNTHPSAHLFTLKPAKAPRRAPTMDARNGGFKRLIPLQARLLDID